MPLTELFRESFITVSLDAQEAILIADWRGYQSVDSVKEGCEAILRMMVQHRAFRVLNDNTNVVGIWRAAADWVAADWFPRMTQAGTQAFAWVYSPTKLSQVSTDTTLSLMDAQAHHVQVFHTAPDALDWLRRVLEEAASGTMDEKRATNALVIEDNADFSRLFRDMLEIMGCKVATASNAEDGLQVALQMIPDVVFCDIGLPGRMNGLEFARAVRVEPGLEKVALIAVSGMTGEEDRQRAEDAGFDRVFPKPVKFVDVSKALAVFGRGRPPGG